MLSSPPIPPETRASPLEQNERVFTAVMWPWSTNTHFALSCCKKKQKLDEYLQLAQKILWDATIPKCRDFSTIRNAKKLQQQIQTDLHISAFILAQGGVQYVWQWNNSTPLWQCPDMHRAILTTSIEREEEIKRESTTHKSLKKLDIFIGVSDDSSCTSLSLYCSIVKVFIFKYRILVSTRFKEEIVMSTHAAIMSLGSGALPASGHHSATLTVLEWMREWKVTHVPPERPSIFTTSDLPKHRSKCPVGSHFREVTLSCRVKRARVINKRLL